jgi:hypothetical protein
VFAAVKVSGPLTLHVHLTRMPCTGAAQAATRQAAYDGRAAGNYLMVVREVLPSSTTCLRTNVDAMYVRRPPSAA